MKTNGNDKALESYKIFPFVAWGLVLFFVFFVYKITTDLRAVAADLQTQTTFLQQTAEHLQNEKTNFER